MAFTEPEVDFSDLETNSMALKTLLAHQEAFFCKTGSDNFFTGSEIFKAGSEANDPNKNSHVLKNDFYGTKIA